MKKRLILLFSALAFTLSFNANAAILILERRPPADVLHHLVHDHARQRSGRDRSRA